MVAEIWASVMSSFVDQLVALKMGHVQINVRPWACSGTFIVS